MNRLRLRHRSTARETGSRDGAEQRRGPHNSHVLPFKCESLQDTAAHVVLYQLSYGPSKEQPSSLSRLGTSTASPGQPRLAAYVGKEPCNSLGSAKDMHSGIRGIPGNRICETGHAFATIEKNPAPEIGAFGGSAEGV